MVAFTEVWTGHRLLRPLLGTGLLGGYTTFSTFAGEVKDLAATGQPAHAALYLVITPAAALMATWVTAALTRHLTRRTS
jgi:CrcB protein